MSYLEDLKAALQQIPDAVLNSGVVEAQETLEQQRANINSLMQDSNNPHAEQAKQLIGRAADLSWELLSHEDPIRTAIDELCRSL